jgi:hypothetical protein
MSNTDLKRVMADLLDGEPTDGVDPRRALQAGHAARRARWIKAGVSVACAAVLVTAVVPWALSAVQFGSDVAPVAPHPTTTTPTPAPGDSVAPFTVGGPIVSTDPSHHRSSVVFVVQNTSGRPVVIDKVMNGIDFVMTNLETLSGGKLTFLGAGATDQLIAAPPAARYAIANAATGQFEPRGKTLNAGDRFAVVISVLFQCTPAPLATFTPVNSAGDPIVTFVGPSTGNEVPVLADIFATPGWVTTAQRDACSA